LGITEYKGCPEPDTDGDGIIDKKDRCPEIADTTNIYGCPDTDRDSLIDLDDRCPDLAGTLANKGCPDTDGDSLVDLDDRCPTLPGRPEQTGCPDQDGDGVVDIDDPCPEVGGVEKMRGCPEIKKEDVAILLKAQKQVRFKTGSAILLPESKKILDQVVALMGRYPEYFLSIAGHTDSQGKDDFNLTLSKKRAKACVDYLLAKKVATERMVHDGFGETKPLADNATATGRLQNRRVEFVLDVKALK
jgi:outer membrane protein OmpA-like peptidoglycan-associated protein